MKILAILLLLFSFTFAEYISLSPSYNSDKTTVLHVKMMNSSDVDSKIEIYITAAEEDSTVFEDYKTLKFVLKAHSGASQDVTVPNSKCEIDVYVDNVLKYNLALPYIIWD